MSGKSIEVKSTRGIENYRDLVGFSMINNMFYCSERRAFRYSYNYADEYVTDTWTGEYVGNTRGSDLISLYSVDGKTKLILVNEVHDFINDSGV